MTRAGLAGECGNHPETDGGGRRTVVVGVKLDSYSKELLTWALVKVAQTGDCVIAIHVLSSNVDQDGKFSLLALIKAFDSVLAVYEGFCNLKQVDLKLKICRGSSIRKVLVCEAKSFLATVVILGTARSYHMIRSSAHVAKYCARKLPKDCSVLAVDNGKVVFKREASPLVMANGCAKEFDDHHRIDLLSGIQRLTRNPKILDGSDIDEKPTEISDQSTCSNLDLVLVNAIADSTDSTLKEKCSICSPGFHLPENSPAQSTESYKNDDENNSMAIVPMQQQKTMSKSVSMLIRELPEVRTGWPLLQRAIQSKGQAIDQSSMQVLVVQGALQLPSRNCLTDEVSDIKEAYYSPRGDGFSELDGENGAIVPVGAKILSIPSSPCHSSAGLPEELEGLHEKYSATCRLFTHEELQQATSNFMPENLIGKGGSSQVYRGSLPDGKELAVKTLNPFEDVLKEFVFEIEIITAMNHKNIISLFGFCLENTNLLLVYDFLPRGSLEENLHGDKKDPLAFGWRERYKVALGIAEALVYLHVGTEKPVIHRDVKPSNILLSDEFEPQLSDFGLAKWASTCSSDITCTDVAGTFGYLAPEYFMYGKVNDKIDVYAFGVVLLELLSGRKPISNDHPKGQEILVMWAKRILNGGKVSQLLDPSLGSNYDCDQMERMVLAASLCIRRSPGARPQMSFVLKLLQGDIEVTKWARLQVNASEGTKVPDDDEAFQHSNLQSHLNLALLDVEDDSFSMSSFEQNISIEEYLKGRCSRASSFA